MRHAESKVNLKVWRTLFCWSFKFQVATDSLPPRSTLRILFPFRVALWSTRNSNIAFIFCIIRVNHPSSLWLLKLLLLDANRLIIVNIFE